MSVSCLLGTLVGPGTYHDGQQTWGGPSKSRVSLALCVLFLHCPISEGKDLILVIVLITS